MIEVIYKEEKQEAQGNETLFAVPRNIRQIGLVRENYRIYIEDYVYTFLGRTASSEKVAKSGKGCAAVLTGEIKWQEGTTYVFIKGALLAKEMEAAADHIDFSEQVWADIGKEQEKYFPEQEIVGWFFAQPQAPVAPSENYARAHLKSFGGEKVLMLMEPTEREDAFFCYENGALTRQSGYYIYYEKNPLMQTYMIEENQDGPGMAAEQPQDEAVKNFRRIIQGKKEQETEEHASVFSYAATVCLAVAVLAVGVNFYQSYRESTGVGEEAQVASISVSDNSTDSDTSSGSNASSKTEETSYAATATAAPTLSPTKEASVTKSLSVTAVPTQASESLEETGSDEIYREESDIRKAMRREALEGENASEGAGESESGTGIASAQTVSENSVHESYVIRPGDTLYQISMERYGSMEAIEAICELNGISQEQIIYPGQIIVLP